MPKKELKLPNQVVNVIKCKNPRCITSIEQGLDQMFVLADKENEVYRCKYCERNIQVTEINKSSLNHCFITILIFGSESFFAKGCWEKIGSGIGRFM